MERDFRTLVATSGRAAMTGKKGGKRNATAKAKPADGEATKRARTAVAVVADDAPASQASRGERGRA